MTNHPPVTASIDRIMNNMENQGYKPITIKLGLTTWHWLKEEMKPYQFPNLPPPKLPAFPEGVKGMYRGLNIRIDKHLVRGEITVQAEGHIAFGFRRRHSECSTLEQINDNT